MGATMTNGVLNPRCTSCRKIATWQHADGLLCGDHAAAHAPWVRLSPYVPRDPENSPQPSQGRKRGRRSYRARR